MRFAKKIVNQIDVRNKRVFVRVDFNVPLDGETITDDIRIVEALPTIKYLIENGAKTILASHLGRPKGGPDPKFSLKPVAKRLGELLGKNVVMAPDCVGPEVEKLAAAMQPGDVMMLENVRFNAGETKNDPEFTKQLAALAECYVNDAFGSAHRAHSSTEGVAHLLSPCAAGFLIQKELEYLGNALETPKRPFIAILGGAKVDTKMGVIESLLGKVDQLYLGGGMCYTFYKAMGYEIGHSLFDEAGFDKAKQLLDAKNPKMILPTDAVVADKFEAGAQTKAVSVDAIPADWQGVDMGPKSLDGLCQEIANAGTVVWNGPVGVFEIDDFAVGTRKVAEAMASSDAITIIGGGDSAAAIKKFGLEKKMTHISREAPPPWSSWKGFRFRESRHSTKHNLQRPSARERAGRLRWGSTFSLRNVRGAHSFSSIGKEWAPLLFSVCGRARRPSFFAGEAAYCPFAVRGRFSSVSPKSIGVEMSQQAVMQSPSISTEGGWFGDHWNRPSGYREVLKLALPFIMTASIWSLQYFVDRIYLIGYSSDAMAAALPAGVFSFTFIAFFVGSAGYANTFVAQYFGAKRPERIGPAVWQAIYFAIFSMFVLAMLAPLAPMIFRLVGHEAKVQALEVEYFRVLCFGAGMPVLGSVLSAFYTGRGKTWTVLAVNAFGVLVNVILDYPFIFGHWGIPEMGMAGAAWATNIAGVASNLVLVFMFLSSRNESTYRTRSGWRYDPEIVRRFIRYGLPNGVNFLLDILAFSFFIAFVGRIGTLELGATQLAFNVNHLIFMPMVGLGMAITTMVGQRLGDNRPDLAARATWSALHITVVYMAILAILLSFFPEVFILPFSKNADPKDMEKLLPLAVMLLRFVALYTIFDSMNVIFSSALRGAGDTRFVLCMSVSIGWLLLVLPAKIIVTYRPAGSLYWCWVFLAIFVVVLGFSFLARFLNGKWRHMRVIEMPVPELPQGLSAATMGIAEVVASETVVEGEAADVE
jgi:putative MATE family efflux protein